MAQTLIVNSQANSTNSTTGGFVFVLPSPNFAAMTLAGTGFKAGLQSIGSGAEENLDYGDVAAASAGWLFMRNTDPTNFVSWGMSDAGTMKAVGTLKAGEPWTQLRVKASVNVRLQADTAACLVEYYLLQT